MEHRISVIIPAYNIEKELPRTLDSVLAQTYQNLEIIVVNDGSKDGTAAVIDAYAAKDSRIRPIHKENGGVTSARLRGVAEATGDWIGFVDGDDCIEPDMYERLMSNALEQGADISHCGYRMVLPSGKVRDYYGTGKLVLQDQFSGVKDLLEGRFVEPGLWNKLYKRELFKGLAERMDFSIRINEDQLMNYYLFRQAKRSVFEDVCLYCYILRPGSAANAAINIRYLEDTLKVKKILFRETEGNGELHRMVGNQMVRHLVRLSTIKTDHNGPEEAAVRRQARRELAAVLSQELTGKSVSLKFKIMGVWVVICPGFYRLVHEGYKRAKGNHTIYEKRE